LSEFPKVSGASEELKKKVAAKFGASLAGKENSEINHKERKGHEG